MMQRILTSAIGLIVFFFVLFANEMVFSAAIAIIIFIALFEMNKALSSGRELFFISLISAAIIIAGILVNNIGFAIIPTMMLYLISSIFLHTQYHFKELYANAFITLFITIFFSTLMRIRSDFGVEAVFLVFVFAWITDSGAYFAGRFFGKHKLIPKVSPKKTVEGAVGGVICAVIFSCLYLFLLRHVFDIFTVGGASYIGMAVLAAVVSVLAQCGDLVASAIKRDCGVKDFGTILPGHGGIMDRFDSVVFIAPFVLYYFIYFNKWML